MAKQQPAPTEQEESAQRLKSASNSKLQPCSCIPDGEDFNAAKKLLQEAGKLKVLLSEKEERLEEIKNQLAALAGGYALDGFRFGKVGFEYHGWTSRNSMSKERLIAQGVTAEQIANAMTPGKEFLNCKIVLFDLD